MNINIKIKRLEMKNRKDFIDLLQMERRRLNSINYNNIELIKNIDALLKIYDK